MDPNSDNAIAVVGVACRFPGANDIDEFWRILVNGENHVTAIPKDRWNNDVLYSSDVDAKGKTYVKSAAFVDRLTEWDNKFFQINDDEASRMDPQQHLILECAYRALENGGFPVEKIAGTNVGCYIGVMANDYGSLMRENVDDRNNYSVTGSAVSIIANRLSFAFNLTGPSLCVDTACSSSLVAVHLGAQGILSGDCKMAICGGVNVILDPNVFVGLCRAKMVSQSGLSQPFSAQADGYARGEGCGVVILKSLKQALSDGDRIWGIVGSACNQDGHFATPITAPSSKQQEELLKVVYSKFQVEPSKVTYIEAHGTGTPVGDPIEATSLGKFIGRARTSDAPYCYIGSVKSNIAHLESAAGVAGLIKVLLMIKNKTIVPTLHFQAPNRHIDFSYFRLEVPTKVMKWEHVAEGRLACVNSFGFGGSNAHAIVKEYIDLRQGQIIHKPVITISAKSKLAMKYSLQHLRNALKNKATNIIEDLSYTSTVRRSHYNNYRFATSEKDNGRLCQALEKAEKELNQEKSKRILRKKRLIFVFPGMGTDWQGMGKDLFQQVSVFRETIVKINNLLSEYTKDSLVDVIKNGNLASGAMKQIAIFAIEIALYLVWSSWGVTPEAVIGHSVGEVAAAFAAGKMSLSTAVKVIFYRSHFLQKVSGGKMAAIGNISNESLDKLCHTTDGRIEVAAINSPTSYTLSGDDEAVATIEDMVLQNKGNQFRDTFFRRLNVDTAFHSQHVQPICSDFVNAISPIERPEIGELVEIYSTVTGCIATDNDYTNSHYWKHNLRQTVQFSKAMEAAVLNDVQNIIVEVGPKQALYRNICEITSEYKTAVFPSMKENEGISMVLKTLCELYQLGVNIDWKSYHRDCPRIPIDLPTYQFNRSETWFKPEVSSQRSTSSVNLAGEGKHQFVHSVTDDGLLYVSNINRRDFPFVYHHMVDGSVVVPGVVYGELALEACLAHLGSQTHEDFKISLQFLKPLMVTEEKDVFIRLKKQCCGTPTFFFQVDSGERSHAKGKIIVCKERQVPTFLNISELKACFVEEIHVDKIYNFLERFGLSYGSIIRPLSRCWKNASEALVMLTIPKEISAQLENTIFHPVLFDGLLQATVVVAYDPTSHETLSKPCFPISVGNVEIFCRPTSNLFIYLRELHNVDSLVSYSAIVMNEFGQVVAKCEDIMAKVLDETSSRVASQLAYNLQWYEIIASEPHERDNILHDTQKNYLTPNCIVFEDSRGIASYLKQSVGVQSHFIGYCDENVNNIDLILQSLQETLHSVEHVLYFWGIMDGCSETTGERFFKSVTSGCLALKHVVKFLARNRAICKLTVVTLCTQSISMITEETVLRKQEESLLSAGLHGAPIWGMVRSLLRENTFDKTILVDLSTGTKEEVLTMACHVFETLDYRYCEYAIIDSRVFTNKLSRVNIDKDYFRKRVTHVQPELPLDVMSNHPHSLEQLELHYSAKTKCIITSKKSFRVYIMKVRMHDPEFLPVTYTGLSLMESLRFLGNKNERYSGLAVDCIGEVLSSNGSIPQGTTVHTCFPIELSSITTVPESLTIKSSDLPYWMQNTPCLSLFVLVWIIFVQKSQEYTSKRLVVEGTKKYQNICRVFSVLASRCGFEEMSYKYTKHDTEHDTPKRLLFLYLGTMPDSVQQWVHKRLPTGSVLINVFNGAGISNFSLSLLRPDVKVIPIDNCQIFQKKYLDDILPKVVKWLKKTAPKMGKDTLKVSEFNFHLTESITQVPSFDDDAIGILLMAPKGLAYADEAHLFHKNACYLVVGGTKGLGLEICKYMSQRGAGYVAILSRNPPNTQKMQELNDIEMNGTRITFLQADVSDGQALSKALHAVRIKLNGIPIRGVFNGAVVLADHLLVNMSDEDFIKATRPKILGAWNLHHLTRNDPLDYFIMHSSTASIFGNRGQTNYSAGNAFLDYLAKYRKQQKLPGQAINWSVLDIGIIESAKSVKKLLLSMGYLALGVNDIVKCFEYALKHDPTQIVFGDFQWSRISHDLKRSELVHVRERYRDFIDVTHESREQKDITVATNDKSQDLSQVSSLYHLVQADIANVLTVETDEIAEDTSLLHSGLDSIQAMTMQSHLREKTGVNIPIVLLLDEETTVSKITHYIEDNISSQKMQKEGVSQIINHETSQKSFRVTDDQAVRFSRTLESPPDVTSNVNISFRLHRRDTTEEYLNRSLRMLMQKHPMLRTKYRFADSPKDIFDVMFDVYDSFDPDVRVLEDVIGEDNTITQLKMASEVPFDLKREFPIRMFLKMVDNVVSHFCLIVHHICCDFFSLTTLMRDLRNAMLSSLDVANGVNCEFAEYLAQRRLLLDAQETDLRHFWEEVFRLPLDFSHGKYSLMITEPASAKAHRFEWDIELLDLKRFASTFNVTPFYVMIAIYAILLHIHSESKDVVIAYPVDMRVHVPVNRDTIGFFINTIPLRVSFRNKNKSITDFIHEIGNMVKSGIKYSLYPLTKIMECGKATANNVPTSFTQHTITWEEYSAFQEVGQSDIVDGVEHIDGAFPNVRHLSFVEIIRNENRNTLSIAFSFNSNYFTRNEGLQFCDEYRNLLQTCLSKQNEDVTDICAKYQDSLQKEEEHIILHHVNSYISMEDTDACGDSTNATSKADMKTDEYEHQKLSIMTHGQSSDWSELEKGISLTKRTSKGFKHKVHLRLQKSPINGALYVTWDYNGKERRISLQDIDVMKIYNYSDDCFLEIRTADKKITFGSSDRQTLLNWAKKMQARS